MVAGLVSEDATWKAFIVRETESHPTEDLAILAVEPPGDGVSWNSIFERIGRAPHSALPYGLWGYPEDAAFELISGDWAVSRILDRSSWFPGQAAARA